MIPKALAAVLVALASLVSGPATAAVTVADRSPFAQGFWWNNQRPGSGFEMFNAAGTAMVTWYTYEASGRAVWYTAQGPVATLGQDEWPLLRHRWVNGAKAPAATVGSVKITLTSSESATFAWTITDPTAGPGSGTQAIVPFIQSGVLREVDRSGTWFDPANSGWGLSLLEQGDVVGGALFTYDPTGEPTWAAGFERGAGSVELFASVGACPACAFAESRLTSAGRIAFDFASESRLALGTANLRLAMASGVNPERATLTQLSRPASARPADRQLAAFDAASLKGFLDAGMLATPAAPLVDFSPAPAAATFSPTNLVEAGVDEASLAKSDGRRVFAYAYDPLSGARRAALRVARVDGDGASASFVGEVPLNGGKALTTTAGLVLYGDKLASVHGNTPTSSYLPWMNAAVWASGVTQVEVFDASGTLPASRWRFEVDGYLITSRRIDAKLYVITRFTPSVPGFAFGPSSATVLAANRQALANAGLEGMLPKARFDNGVSQPALAASDVYAPPQGTRRASPDLIMVTVIDLAAERVVQTLAIAGSVEAVYASTGNLFLASARQDLRDRSGTIVPDPYGSLYRTDVHQVALEPAGLRIVGTGSLEGYLDSSADRAPYRLSEHQSKLRVVTTTNQSLPSLANRVSVLEPSTVAPGQLKVLSTLPNANRPQPLGKAGESLYATRFVGDRLYAVTFRVVDPLYVVDLSDAADPKIAGALELPGFSEYLHPLGNGLLLGFGKDAVPAFDFGDGAAGAWYQGLKVALFDVSDASRPRTIASRVIGQRGSDSALLKSHHALSVLPLGSDRVSLAFPAKVHDTVPTFGCCTPSTFYDWSWSGLMTFEVQGPTPATAKLVERAALATHTRSAQQPYAPLADAAGANARSVLFPAGTVYVGNGSFWHMDAAGVVKGPF